METKEVRESISIIKNLFGIMITYIFIFTSIINSINGQNILPYFVGFVVTSVINYVIFS